ncbi:hypothetical protein NE237_020791 [Protea cynaroides]|uniref:Uncharacterized protein n=1 Tax=Protea cynaroides TaxID=273540 RepID=A0A9Q0H944_9MAGN|nr:hypothetical protein NE237_020791 [Protea cynaroides]
MVLEIELLRDTQAGMEEDNEVKYVLQKVNEIREMEGEQVLQYLMKQLNEILVWLHYLGSTLLHKLDEILPPHTRSLTLRDWIIWIAMTLVVALFVSMFFCFCLQLGFWVIRTSTLFVRLLCCICMQMAFWLIKTLVLIVQSCCCLWTGFWV